MKRAQIRDYVFRPGEYIVGAEATGSHACYLLYGSMREGEERNFSPGEGHEEILCVIEGAAAARSTDNQEFVLEKGHWVFLAGTESVVLTARSPFLVYVIAGGHTPGGHSHHHGDHGVHDEHGDSSRHNDYPDQHRA